MPDETKSEGNGKLTDEQLIAVSEIDIQDEVKYCNDDRRRRKDLLAKARTDRYVKDPDTFVEISELICAVIRHPTSQLGVAVLIGECKRSELNQAEAELNHRLFLARRQMDLHADLIHQGKAIPQKGGIIGAARRGIFGK